MRKFLLLAIIAVAAATQLGCECCRQNCCPRQGLFGFGQRPWGGGFGGGYECCEPACEPCESCAPVCGYE